MPPKSDIPTPSLWIQSGDWGTMFVVLVVVVAAYVPVLSDPDIANLSLFQIGLLFGLGLLYLFMATLVFNRLVHEDSLLLLILFFAIQIGLILIILTIGQNVNNGLWLLALPTVAQSLSLGPAGAAAVTLSLLVGMSGLIYAWGAPLNEVFQFTMAIAAAMVFTLVFTNTAVRAQQAHAKVEDLATQLSAANQQLREYAVQAEELATTQERNRLAREIHDTLGHFLTIINVQLNAAQAVFDQDPDRAKGAIERAQRLTQEGLVEVRQSVATLRSTPTGNRPLPDVLSSLAAETRATGLVTNVTVTGEPRPLDPRVELTLYRAAQEGLTNARKHAHASRVDLHVNYTSAENVCLTVQDNGVGTEQMDGGFGLLGLRERVHLLGGQVDVETAPGAGFTLSVQVPG